MVQNRNKIIDLLIGNLSNAIIHTILEKSTNNPELTSRYEKESANSLNIAISYREKINPINTPLPDVDLNYIRDKIINRVKSELNMRISKGYMGINLDSTELEVNNILKKLKIF